MRELIPYINTSMIRPGCDLNRAVNWLLASRNIENFEYVQKTLERHPWVISELVLNHNITLEFIRHCFKQKIKLNMGQYGLSANPAFLEFIDENPDTPDLFWGVGGVSSNVGLTAEFIRKYSDRLDFGSLAVSILPCATPSLVLEFPEKNWSFDKTFGLSFEDPRGDEDEEKKE